MILAFLGFLAYEIGTTILGFSIMRWFTGNSLNQRMRNLKQIKRMRLVDQILKKEVGTISKMEMWMSKKLLSAVQKVSKYQSTQYLLILAGRSALSRSSTARNAFCAKLGANKTGLDTKGVVL